jgi:uncharacterized protein DUF4886
MRGKLLNPVRPAADQHRVAFAGRVLIKLVRLLAAVVVGIVLWVAAIQAGIVRNPLDPVIRGDIELARSDRPGMRVLFVGNSFTFHNSLPKLVRRLAEADRGSKRIFAVQYAASNWKLKSAADDDGLDRLLLEVDWDVLVLQEHSLKLSFSPEYRREQTDPHARAIIARAGGARALLFMTWGYKNGDRSSVPGDSYLGMQQRLAYNYRDLGEEVGAEVAPVGLAWAEALERRPGIDLWWRDGRHPGKRGSYLAGCVFYAVLSGRDPSGNEFTGGLDVGEARFLQHVARDVVLAE